MSPSHDHLEPTPPQKAIVCDRPEEAMISIALSLGGRLQSLQRPKDEPLEKAFGRLRAKMAPPISKKDKRKQEKPSEPLASDLAITLYSDYSSRAVVDPTASNSVAWREGRVLEVGPELFSVVYNPPMMTDKGVVLSSKRAILGMPLVAHPYLLFAQPELTRYQWERRGSGATGSSSSWKEIKGATGAVYHPTADDLGQPLRVLCTPGRQGEDEEEVILGETITSAESSPVESAPERSVLTIRGRHCKPSMMAKDNFRVVSYNILADQYAGSNYAQKVLFHYCPPRCLEPEYRKTLTAAELEMYNADLICLQEVDERAFHEHYQPFMDARGFSGRYTNKMGKVKEGSATFWRRSRFAEVAREDVLLRDVFEEAGRDVSSPYKSLLDASLPLRDALKKVTTIAQATILQVIVPKGEGEGEKEGEGEGEDGRLKVGALICVVNCHLFYHPYAPHIRTIHTSAIMERAHHLISSHQKGKKGKPPALIFCGDLNSDLNDGVPGVVELLQSGRLSSSYWDWSQGAAFKWGMEEGEGSTEQQANAPKPPGGKLAAMEAMSATEPLRPSPSKAVSSVEGVEVVGIDLEIPFGPLRSADDLKTPFTNYTSGYKALLDYCWYEPGRIEVVEEGGAQVPSEGEMQALGFIPNAAFPSDHLAVVYDLWLKEV